MEDGFVNASGVGIVWFSKPGKFWLFGKDTQRLQKDWWGWSKKESLPASKCRDCQIVVFQYK